MLISEIEKVLDIYQLLNKDTVFILGFSGGYDSFCLLDIMSKLSKKYLFDVIVAHLNHNWRGNEASNEQKRCQEIASFYGLKFITEILEKNVKPSENDARIARYNFFNKYAKKYNAIVLTAHNANDNAETLIYRIIKGTGILGLEGIPQSIQKDGVKYLRPLLNIKRVQIENYCKKNNLIPNVDSSNESLIYKRNFIRNKIIPLMESVNPNVIESINSLSILAVENNSLINNFIGDVINNKKISVKKYINFSNELKPKIIHSFLKILNLEYDRKKILQIVNFLDEEKNKNKKFSLTTNLWLKFDDNNIYTVSQVDNIFKAYDFCEPNIYKLENGAEFGIVECNVPEEFPNANASYAYVNISKIDFPLTIRTRRDGDVFQPFGMKGKMKLKKFLISKKIPQEKRDELLLVAKGNEILWIIGVALSEKLRVAKTTLNVFKCYYKYGAK